MTYRNLGFSLIEVLIALVIVVISLLGLASIQLSALRETQGNYWKTVAATQVVNMSERIYVNINGITSEIVLWDTNNQQLLPQGHGTVTCENLVCTVTIIWKEQQGVQYFSMEQTVSNGAKH